MFGTSIKPSVVEFFNYFNFLINKAHSRRIPDYCIVSQAKMSAAVNAIRIIKDDNISRRYISLLSDNKSTVRTVGSNIMNSKTIYCYRKSLNEIAER